MSETPEHPPDEPITPPVPPSPPPAPPQPTPTPNPPAPPPPREVPPPPEGNAGTAASGPEQDVTPREGTEPDETPPPPETPRDPEEYADVAGVYVYTGEETTHPKIGRLVPGENDFSEVTHPEVLKAIQSYAQESPEVLHKA